MNNITFFAEKLGKIAYDKLSSQFEPTTENDEVNVLINYESNSEPVKYSIPEYDRPTEIVHSEMDSTRTVSSQNVIDEIQFKKYDDQLYQAIDMCKSTNTYDPLRLRRRFQMDIEDIFIKDVLDTKSESCFLLFIIGGTLNEFTVSLKNSSILKSLLAGYPGKHFYSNPFNLNGTKPVKVNVDISIEWHGSYINLEKESLIIQLWKENSYSFNECLGVYREFLVDICQNTISRDFHLIDDNVVETDNKTNQTKNIYIVSSKISFQEIYDYEIQFSELQLNRILEKNIDNLEDFSNTNKNKIIIEEELPNELLIMNSQRKSLLENQRNSLLLRFLPTSMQQPIIQLKILSNKLTRSKVRTKSSIKYDDKQNAYKFEAMALYRATQNILYQMKVAVQLRNMECYYDSDDKEFINSLKGEFYLKDMNNTNYIDFTLYDSTHNAYKASIKSLTPYLPKYKQSGNPIINKNSEECLYIKFTNIQNIFCDFIHDIDLEYTNDTHIIIEATLRNIKKRTLPINIICLKDLNHTLIFEADELSLNKKTQFNSDAKNIMIDLWMINDKKKYHIGFSELSLSDIEIAKINNNFRVSCLTYYSIDSRKELFYDANESCNVEVQVWCRPSNLINKLLSFDVSALNKKTDNIMENIKNSVICKEETVCADFLTSDYQLWSAKNHRNIVKPLSEYICSSLRLPNIVTPLDAFSFVKSLNYQKNDMDANRVSTVYSVDYAIETSLTSPLTNIIILTSLFIGLGIPSLACIGYTLNGKKVYYTLTLQKIQDSQNDIRPLVQLWDPLNSVVYIESSKNTLLREAIHHVDSYFNMSLNYYEEAIESYLQEFTKNDLSKFPNERENYIEIKSEYEIDTKFYLIDFESQHIGKIKVLLNHSNIYYNDSMDNSAYSLDFTNTNIWRNVYKNLSNISYIPEYSSSHCDSQLVLEKRNAELRNHIIRFITTNRVQSVGDSNLTWLRHSVLLKFVEEGLELLLNLNKTYPYEGKHATIKQKIDAWKSTLISCLPIQYKFQWLYLFFNHSNKNIIASFIWNNVKLFKQNNELFLGGMKIISVSELEKHDTIQSCWIALHGKVYDITSYLPKHPGGEFVLLNSAGQDVTKEFEDIGHSAEARMLLKKYEIGILEGSEDTAKDALDILSAKQISPIKLRDFLKYTFQFIPLSILLVSFLIWFLN